MLEIYRPIVSTFVCFKCYSFFQAFDLGSYTINLFFLGPNSWSFQGDKLSIETHITFYSLRPLSAVNLVTHSIIFVLERLATAKATL